MNLNTKKKILFDLAIILHDVGKVNTLSKVNGNISFLGHDEESVKIAEKALERLKVSNNDKKYIIELIKHHMILHRISDLDKEKQKEQLAELFIKENEDAELITDMIILAEKDSNISKTEYDFLKRLVTEFSNSKQLIKGSDVENFPERIRAKLIKRMRWFQLAKDMNKSELFKIMKSEANNILENINKR